MTQSPSIIYTWTDEAPALATHAFLRAISAFVKTAGVEMETRDISLAARVLAQFPELLGDCEIKEFSGTDYAFRIFVEKTVWSKVLVGLNEEMDYDNFKSKVARHQGGAGADYEHSLHEVWSVMNRLQE